MKYFVKLSLMLGVACCALTGTSVQAKDLGDGYFSAERFQVRVRGIGIFADGDGNINENGLVTDVGDAATPEIDFTYFFTENIAAELIAATAEHSVKAGTLDVGETMILPPTLTLQYHFTPDNQFSPYVGAGINYSYFYSDESGNGFNGLDVEGGFGFALQAGADYWLNENWGLNVDFKYIDLDIDADVNLGSTALSADDITLNPWVVGAGVSYRF